MPEIFKGLFDSTASVISVGDFMLCLGTALVIGIVIAFAYCFKNRSTKSFIMTLVLIPAAVCAVIMMVNGNIGAGVAVAGAFSLVRFRSAPGSAKEIAAIFIAMGAGLIAGMGYLAYSVLFSLVLCAVFMLLNLIRIGERSASGEKVLKMTVPEDLNYDGVFDDLFKEYTVKYRMTQVKTTNMGSLFKLKYELTLKDIKKEKEFIDKLRCRNGNLEISISCPENNGEL